jgi:hypothetical protein
MAKTQVIAMLVIDVFKQSIFGYIAWMSAEYPYIIQII